MTSSSLFLSLIILPPTSMSSLPATMMYYVHRSTSTCLLNQLCHHHPWSPWFDSECYEMKRATRWLKKKYKATHSPNDYSPWHRQWTVSVHCSRQKTPSTGDQLSHNPDMTPEHCG